MIKIVIEAGKLYIAIKGIFLDIKKFHYNLTTFIF